MGIILILILKIFSVKKTNIILATRWLFLFSNVKGHEKNDLRLGKDWEKKNVQIKWLFVRVAVNMEKKHRSI